MALHYWEVEPGFFQSNLGISAPCPEELFQVLILTNYLRAISSKPELASKRHAGTRMVLEKLDSFSAPKWALKMKGFRGWRPSGDGVQFDNVEASSSPPKYVPSQKDTTPKSAESSPESLVKVEETSPIVIEAQESDLWLNIGIIYHSAISLYATRTLIIDLPEDKDFLSSRDAAKPDLETMRRESRQALADCLTPIFSDPVNAHQLGKLVYFPMFVCGMEAKPDEEDLQNFVVNGLQMVGRACGTLGPISAADELRGYWAACERKEDGGHVSWDEYFGDRPDFIFGF
ncbi:hypothetical protein JX265_006489 [Neoarthrinium moseri]|uniref:Uncharacterized protein n=1 Tax=Neoarthrinium moseri TaxID=1658444 RepID=A0A9P9WLF9_9PEZI|nr:hypothetical protein JX265_006489 [Neoarthrinium moseri]